MRNFIISLLFFPLFALAKPNSVVYNLSSNQVVSGVLDSEKVSIASISKLMTVYTVLMQDQSLTEKLKVTGNKVTNTKIRKGMILTRIDLLRLSLVSSDNLAAMTLSENFPGGRVQFIQDMNKHAVELGMTQSGFIEPTGLSLMNFSTVTDIVKLTKAVSVFNIVQESARSSTLVTHYSMVMGKHDTKLSSNPTTKYFGQQGIITIKTGFTNAAGYCITMIIRANNQLYNITVLGAKTKQEREAIVKKSLAAIY
jgi:D-alanyl-D-alanine endopeptidase (penicillin-binding protein 7)